jgi:hypothetical protein
MRSIIFIFCIIIATTFASSEEQFTDTSEEERLANDVVNKLLDHYEQIDLAPFVPIQKAKEEARKAIIVTIAAFIHTNHFNEARRLIVGVKDANAIRDAVVTAYDGELESTIKIIAFFKTLDRKIDQMKGFSALYDEMKSGKTMENPAIIEIGYWMQHHLDEADLALDTDEFPERFYFYDSEKHSIITDAMNRLAKQIKSGNNDEVIMLSKAFPGALSAVLPKLVQTTFYNNVNNFDRILELANKEELPRRHRDIVLDSLLTEMNQNNQVGTPQFQTLKNTINTSTSSMLKKKVSNIARNNQ